MFLGQLIELGKADKLLGMQILHQILKAFQTQQKILPLPEYSESSVSPCAPSKGDSGAQVLHDSQRILLKDGVW